MAIDPSQLDGVLQTLGKHRVLEFEGFGVRVRMSPQLRPTTEAKEPSDAEIAAKLPWLAPPEDEVG